MIEAATAQQFLGALQVLERDRDPNQMIALFTENSFDPHDLDHQIEQAAQGR